MEQQNVALQLAQITVMVFAGESYVFPEPERGKKGKRVFFCGKFYFYKDQRRKAVLEDVQLSGEPAFQRDHVTLLADEPSVDLRKKMFICFLGKREIIFLPCQESFGLVGQLIQVVILPDAYDRVGIQIPLRDEAAGIGFFIACISGGIGIFRMTGNVPGNVFRKMVYQIFAFDFHCGDLLGVLSK